MNIHDDINLKYSTQNIVDSIMDITTKTIFSPQLANYLLKEGYQILKLKAKHGSEDETIFVFRFEDGMLDAMETWASMNPNR